MITENKSDRRMSSGALPVCQSLRRVTSVTAHDSTAPVWTHRSPLLQQGGAPRRDRSHTARPAPLHSAGPGGAKGRWGRASGKKGDQQLSTKLQGRRKWQDSDPAAHWAPEGRPPGPASLSLAQRPPGFCHGCQVDSRWTSIPPERLPSGVPVL